MTIFFTSNATPRRRDVYVDLSIASAFVTRGAFVRDVFAIIIWRVKIGPDSGRYRQLIQQIARNVLQDYEPETERTIWISYAALLCRRMMTTVTWDRIEFDWKRIELVCEWEYRVKLSNET